MPKTCIRPRANLSTSAVRDSAVQRAFLRIRSWGAPPNWSGDDWWMEARAITAAAGWSAERIFDVRRCGSLGAFIYGQALASAWMRFRQEWSYSTRCSQFPKDGFLEPEVRRQDEELNGKFDLILSSAMSRLPASDQWLLEQLYWRYVPQKNVAQTLGMTQQAVSRRKTRILEKLRAHLNQDAVSMVIAQALAWIFLFLDSDETFFAPILGA